MPIIPSLPTFSPNTLADANDLTTALTNIRDTVNTYGLLTDVARTVTAIQTFSAAPVFSAGWSAGAACTVTTGGLTVSAGGVTVTGNSTITGTLGGVTTLTVTTVGATTFSGTPNFSGTPTFGAGFTVTAGTATVTGNLAFSGDNRKLVSGTTGMTFRNAADSASWLTWSDPGGVTLGGVGYNAHLGDGSMAASATSGFPVLPVIAGAPSGAPVSIAAGACVVDSTNHRLYLCYGGAWKYVGLT